MDPPVDAVFAGGVVDVTADRRAIGQDACSRPGPKPIAEGHHVRVGADSWVAKQVPRAADGLAPLQDGHALGGTFARQMTGHADARNAGANDQNVVVIAVHGCLQLV